DRLYLHQAALRTGSADARLGSGPDDGRELPACIAHGRGRPFCVRHAAYKSWPAHHGIGRAAAAHRSSHPPEEERGAARGIEHPARWPTRKFAAIRGLKRVDECEEVVVALVVALVVAGNHMPDFDGRTDRRHTVSEAG